MPLSSYVKRKIVGVATLLVIFILLGAVFVFEHPQSPDFVAYELQVQKVFEDAKVQFELIRNVTLPSDVKCFVYTREQAVGRWGNDPSGLNTVSVLRQENIYKGLFLIDDADSLVGAAAEWTASWMAVSVGHEIYVIYENFCPWTMPEAEAVLIHEFTHVWQADLPVPNSYDAERAYVALLEGDATYISDYYRTQYYIINHNVSRVAEGYDYSKSRSLSDLHSNSLGDSIYPLYGSGVVVELNLFPYVKGRSFVSALVDRDGWDTLNLCYSPNYLPSATAHILHPDKYFADETPKTLPTPTPVDNTWVNVPSKYGYPSDTYGEHFIYVMLNRWLSDNQAQKVAAGWCGDSFAYYEKDQDFLFAWHITWNSPQHANAFNQAFTDMLNIAGANPQGDNVWFTNGRYLTLTWNPNTQSTLILCSTNQTATNSLFFTY